MAGSVRFVPNPGLAAELLSDPALQRDILSRGQDVRRGILAQLPSGKSGGVRVRAFAGRSYTDTQGTGREFHVRVGTFG